MRAATRDPAQMSTDQHCQRSRFLPHPLRRRDPRQEVQENLSHQDRIALRITRAIGTMWAVYAFATFMLGWMLLQVALGGTAFDPYPFVFLLFLGNIVQLPRAWVGARLTGHRPLERALPLRVTCAVNERGPGDHRPITDHAGRAASSGGEAGASCLIACGPSTNHSSAWRQQG